MGDNKGFSLLELIIVIAIMAVLVGFIVPQYFKYVNKSKLANDKQLVTAVQNALNAALIDENIANRPIYGFTPSPQIELADLDTTYYGSYPEFVDEFKSFVQVDSISTLNDRIKSKEYEGQTMLVEIDATTQRVKVTLPAKPGGEDFVVE